jgi:hypothetical protein
MVNTCERGFANDLTELRSSNEATNVALAAALQRVHLLENENFALVSSAHAGAAFLLTHAPALPQPPAAAPANESNVPWTRSLTTQDVMASVRISASSDHSAAANTRQATSIDRLRQSSLHGTGQSESSSQVVIRRHLPNSVPSAMPSAISPSASRSSARKQISSLVNDGSRISPRQDLHARSSRPHDRYIPRYDNDAEPHGLSSTPKKRKLTGMLTEGVGPARK